MKHIKWLRMRQAAEKALSANGISGKRIIINASTDMAEEFRSLVEWNIKKTSVQIYLNLQHNKTVDDVIVTLSHELAHVIVNQGSEAGATEESAAVFNEVQERLVDQLRAFYSENVGRDRQI